MPRQEYEEYVQDRLGNTRRKFDDTRSQAGMSTDNGIITDTTTAGSTDTAATSQVVIYEIPDDIQASHVIEIVVDNQSSDDADNDLTVEYFIESVTLDSNGNIDTSTQRSVRNSVGANSRNVEEYTGEEFSEDAIAINLTSGTQGSGNTASLDVEAGVSVRNDHKEYHEAASEQTATPSS